MLGNLSSAAVMQVEARDLCQGMALDILAQEQVTVAIHKVWQLVACDNHPNA